MAISTALRRFSDLGRTVTPVFLLMDHFLYQFSAFSEKMKKIYRLESFIFCKMHDRISVLFSSSFIGATVSNAF